MVMFALPQELVEVRVSRNFKGYSEAILIRVLEASPHRVEPKCPLFGECGGCHYQHLSYEMQLVWKRQHVLDALKGISKVDVPEEIVETTWPSPLQYHWRTKHRPKLQGISSNDGLSNMTNASIGIN